MVSCKELTLDDVMAITAIPLENYSDEAYVNVLSPVISESDFDPIIDGNTIVIGLVKASTVVNEQETPVGSLIPIIHSTGKVKDTEANSAAGRAHTVSIDCEVDDRETDVWPLLYMLERTPYHLLLTFRGGARGFVMVTEDTYQCTVERENKKTSVNFKVHSLMGLQLIADTTEAVQNSDTINGLE